MQPHPLRSQIDGCLKLERTPFKDMKPSELKKHSWLKDYIKETEVGETNSLMMWVYLLIGIISLIIIYSGYHELVNSFNTDNQFNKNRSRHESESESASGKYYH